MIINIYDIHVMHTHVQNIMKLTDIFRLWNVPSHGMTDRPVSVGMEMGSTSWLVLFGQTQDVAIYECGHESVHYTLPERS